MPCDLLDSFGQLQESRDSERKMHAWRSMGRIYPDWEEKYISMHFRVSKDTFWFLGQTYGKYFK